MLTRLAVSRWIAPRGKSRRSSLTPITLGKMIWTWFLKRQVMKKSTFSLFKTNISGARFRTELALSFIEWRCMEDTGFLGSKRLLQFMLSTATEVAVNLRKSLFCGAMLNQKSLVELGHIFTFFFTKETTENTLQNEEKKTDGTVSKNCASSFVGRRSSRAATAARPARNPVLGECLHRLAPWVWPWHSLPPAECCWARPAGWTGLRRMRQWARRCARIDRVHIHFPRHYCPIWSWTRALRERE